MIQSWQRAREAYGLTAEDIRSRRVEAATPRPEVPTPLPPVKNHGYIWHSLSPSGFEFVNDRRCVRCSKYYTARFMSKMVMCRACWETMDGQEHIARWHYRAELSEFRGWPQQQG